MTHLELPIRAATETLAAHGIAPDRCDILQDGSTLVLRLTDTLVARVVQDRDGPRQGTDWFARENAIAQHLTRLGSPVIPLHPAVPPGPHEHLGYPMSFWVYVTRVEEAPLPEDIGRTLRQCHEALRSFQGDLPKLGIITEAIAILEKRQLFAVATQQMLHDRLTSSLERMADLPAQPLHGDAHLGNLMNTTRGLLLTDWEDAFLGPIEWDLASLIWNAQILEEDHAAVRAMRGAYGPVDEDALSVCLVARAAVITAWYPILYPNPNADRQEKLSRRIEWLAANAA